MFVIKVNINPVAKPKKKSTSFRVFPSSEIDISIMGFSFVDVKPR